MQTTLTIFSFIYGTIFGSFFNVVGLRVPKKTLFKQERSYCDTCERTLTWSELIPIWSYVFQKGRCKKCKEKISPLYPIMETATGILFAFTYTQFGFTHEFVLGLLLIALIIPVTVSDLAYQLIPNRILLFFTPLFIIYRFIYPLTPWWNSLTGAGVAFTLVFFVILLSKGGMGMGDLKYFTLFGFIFGWQYFLLLFFLSTLYGTLVGIVIMKKNKTGLKTKMAFGPSIGLAALTVFYFGEAIVRWYLQFLN